MMKTLPVYQVRNGLEQLPFSHPSSSELQNNISYSHATVMKTLQGSQPRNGPDQWPFSNPSPPELAAAESNSSTTKWKDNGEEKKFLLGNRYFSNNHLRGWLKQRKTSILPTGKHHRSQRDVDTTSKSTVDPTVCANNTYTIMYEDNYKVWNDFSITYRGIKLLYDLYRVTDSGLQVCNSTDPVIVYEWSQLMATEKQKLASKHCNVSVEMFFWNSYTIYKNFTVFFKPTQQSFTRKNYGVIIYGLYYGLYHGFFAICSAKLSVSNCNDHLVRVNYSEEYKVFKNFSLSYHKKHYDYREYRFEHDAFELCASNDSRVQDLWKSRNSWNKIKNRFHCPNTLMTINKIYYVVGKQFNVFFVATAQSFKKHEYIVFDGKFYICGEMLKQETPNLTKEDMLLCNDSLEKIKFDEEYKVWNNFSILYKNKMYDYTEYRILDDSIDICNSKDKYVQDSWKLHNEWAKKELLLKHCNVSMEMFIKNNYTIFKNFTVFFKPTQQSFTRKDYGVFRGFFAICSAKLSVSNCNDNLVRVKYSEEYKVFKNFSLSYHKKHYDYREYRFGHDGFELCASNNCRVQDLWKSRNSWNKEKGQLYCLNKLKTSKNYVVGKQFNVFLVGSGQSLKKHEYTVSDGKFFICGEKLKPETPTFTKEDMLLCKDSLEKIKFYEEYILWYNFSIRYKNKVYHYTEYRVLNDSINICNSRDNHVQDSWKLRNEWAKKELVFRHCNASVDGFFWNSYTLFKDFRVLFKPAQQYLTNQDYGVYMGYFAICSAKISVSNCNDHLVRVNYSEEYKVFKNFSLSYHKKQYDYREYRFGHDAFELCASNNSKVQDLWKSRNSWNKIKSQFYCPNPLITINKTYYVVGKQFNVFFVATAQSFKKHEYMVFDGQFFICGEKLKPETPNLTKEDILLCKDSLIKIKFDEKYKVWNNFSILYKNKVYHYTEYRILNDSIHICNSKDNYVRDSWKLRNDWVKQLLPFKHCNASVDGFFWNNYTLFKNFTVFFIPTQQSFARNNYGVILGYFAICSAKLSLSCNDHLIKVNYSEEYKVFKNFSLSYHKKYYDYREYRFGHDAFELCASNNSRIQDLWKIRNSWNKGKGQLYCPNKQKTSKNYIVGKQFNVFFVASGQSLKRHEYTVSDGKFFICGEKLKPETPTFTKEDMLLCKDSLEKIKFYEEYILWYNFSIRYKNKVYDYTEYRVLNDSINICNSRDNHVQDSWKLRNEWAKKELPFRHCNASVDGFFWNSYTLFKDFRVLFKPAQQYLTNQDYGVYMGYFAICSAKLSVSNCNDHLVRVNYSEEYKVFKNFSLSYHKKQYDYREYRFGHDAFELCASNNSKVQNIWKTRNSWDKGYKDQTCSSSRWHTIKKSQYVVGKQFNAFLAESALSFEKQEYNVIHGQLSICDEKLKPKTPNFTKEDMLLCKDSLIKIKFDKDYKVWNNFSILYKNKVYDYNQYRILNDSIDICNSTNKYVRDSWKLRNEWVKNSGHLFSCKRTARVWTFRAKQFTVLKDFSVRISLTEQVIPKGHYGVSYKGKLEICEGKFNNDLYLIFIDPIVIAPFCALGLSIICLMLLLVVYGMLPELRNLPGLNLMSLSFAFLLLMTFNVLFSLLYLRVGEVFKMPCGLVEIASRFAMNCIFTNGAVNIYHLKKTFCRNTLVKSDQNKWKTFLKYCLFSWGVPVVLAVVYIVLVSKDILKFNQSRTESTCVDGHDLPGWLALMEEFGLPCCLLLYIITMFIITSYRIHEKLKASRTIAQKSNVVRKRKSFVILLKLSTTTAISWIPLLVINPSFKLNLNIAISTIAWLSGVYVGIAFVFTRKNYQLLRKKYFPAKKKPVNENMAG